MANSIISRTYVTKVRRRTNFVWPIPQMWIWVVFTAVSAGTVLGVFGNFMLSQNRLGLGIPWVMPFGVTVGSLTIALIITMIVLMIKGTLNPSIVLLASFMLFVLFITGCVATALQLFGPAKVASNCNKYVNNSQQSGVSIETLAWLQQNSICSSWYAAFSFWIVGSVFFVWMFFIASLVGRGAYDNRR